MDVLTNGLTHVLSLNVSFAKMTSNFKIDGPPDVRNIVKGVDLKTPRVVAKDLARSRLRGLESRLGPTSGLPTIRPEPRVFTAAARA